MADNFGKAFKMSSDVVNNWKANVEGLLCDYGLDDIYNCDETGFFWRSLPNRTLSQKGESCVGDHMPRNELRSC